MTAAGIVVGAKVVVTGQWSLQAKTSGTPHPEDRTGATRVNSQKVTQVRSAEGNDTVYTVTGFHGRFAALSDGKDTYAWPTDLLELAPLEDLAARLDEKWGTGAGEQVTT